MRYPGAWGGEPEILLLASHVLKRPIEVHMAMSGERYDYDRYLRE